MFLLEVVLVAGMAVVKVVTLMLVAEEVAQLI